MNTLDKSDCRLSTPQPQGLYHPRNEHDACGMGLVANIRGEKSHEIVRKGLEVLINLTHRGAAGCDPETGDGAGILIQIPHEFFARDCGELGTQLPGPGEYTICAIPRRIDPTFRTPPPRLPVTARSFTALARPVCQEETVTIE